jgi:hypothetical protein
MSRTSVAILERELEFARKREAWLKRTDRPVKQTVDPRPKILVGYRSSLVKVGAASAFFKIQASAPSLVFLGAQAALGLTANTGSNLDEAIRPSRGFKPAMIKATVGDATPSVRTARGSGRRYINYAANAQGNAQAHYSAPISKIETLVTADEQKAAAVTRANAITSTLGGDYGRVSFTPEQFTQALK